MKTSEAIISVIDLGGELVPEHRPLIELCRDLEGALRALYEADTGAGSGLATEQYIEAKRRAARVLGA
jgi:hypothetical protein